MFLNAHDPRFYKRELLNPSLTVWVLSQLSIEKSHALKRMFESAWRQNIQLKVMEVDKFELIASQEGLETILYEGKIDRHTFTTNFELYCIIMKLNTQ